MRSTYEQLKAAGPQKIFLIEAPLKAGLNQTKTAKVISIDKPTLVGNFGVTASFMAIASDKR